MTGLPLSSKEKEQGIVNFNASGKATGPDPGTFKASGSYLVTCVYYAKHSINANFTIVSGSTTITGRLSGPVKTGCIRFAKTCIASGQNLAYQAMINGKSVSGNAAGHFDTTSTGLGATLKAL
jgi:hypothetical protein